MFTNIQGLIQKEKVDIDGEKSVQISIVPKKIVTQGWSEVKIMKYKQAIHYICFLFSWYIQYYVYIMLMIWSKSWNYVYWLLAIFNKDYILACPNWCALNQYTNVQHSLYQPLISLPFLRLYTCVLLFLRNSIFPWLEEILMAGWLHNF